MELQEPDSTLRGLHLIEAFTARSGDGLVEIARAALAVNGGVETRDGTDLLRLLLDVLGAVELLEIENYMVHDVAPDELRDAVGQAAASRLQSKERIEGWVADIGAQVRDDG